VSEYMLKPVMEEDLKNTLERSLQRLENVKEMNDYLLEIQDYIDTLQHMDQNMIMEKQSKIVESILKLKSLHPGARKSLFRIFS
jgi:two-component system response regulator YesN